MDSSPCPRTDSSSLSPLDLSQAQLASELGRPVLILKHTPELPQGRILSFAPGEGEGLVLLRSAKWGPQLLEQWRAVRPVLQQNSLRPRIVLAAGGLSGMAPLQRRLDLLLLRGCLASSWCSWLACSDLMRISRTQLLCHETLAYLRDNDCRLYLASEQRPDLARSFLTPLDSSISDRHMGSFFSLRPSVTGKRP
jgi:hypothetical protein